MAKDFPESYADPLYAQLDSGNEQKLGLPVGLLSSIRTAGEKTNASRVSSAGAQTPYQFTPSTQKAILDKYGIDVKLSPENASEGAGLLLKESLARNNGDVERAVREYHGGTDPKNWGKVNNAYAGRVLAAQSSAKIDALSQGFEKFMQASQAQPAQAQAAPALKEDALSKGFGEFLKMGAPKTVADAIPRDDGTYGPSVVTLDAPTSLADKAIGTGEAALTALTGATGGTLGMIGGTAKGLVDSVRNGTFGTPEGIRQVEETAGKGMEALTFAPRTQSGQNQAAALGEAGAAVLPVAALAPEMAALGSAASGAAQTVRPAAAVAASRVGTAADSAVSRLRQASPAIADRVERILSRNPEPQTTRGTLASGGAAGTDLGTQRIEAAENLPVPVQLTEGQITRDQQQLRFENETAKGEFGQKIRDRYSDQNSAFDKNFDAWVDQTEATAPDLRTAGKMVDDAVRKKAARDKAEIRTAYTQADKSPEAQQPVTLQSAVDFLNESAPDQAVSNLLVASRRRAVQLGIAAEDEAGNLVAQPTTVKNAELYRRSVGQATDYEPTNVRNSAVLKGAIDAELEGAGGDLYRSARRLRENYAKQYENRAVINDLLRTAKNGSMDRKVALEDVFNHSILKSDMDDVRHLRRVLQTGGEEGSQAWKELQGRTVQWIKDQAFSNSATDQRGNTIMSAAKLDRALKQLDHDGKLDFIFGKQGAAKMRDINDLAKFVYTTPPGTVNTSNTAGVIAAMLAEAGTLGATTGLPVPILTGAKILAKQVREKKLRARIERSLNTTQNRRPNAQ